jgi:DnaK suppressor protein
MKKKDKEKFKTLLSDMRKAILREIQHDVQTERDGEAGDGRDTYDIASDERDREINLLLGDRDRRKLQQTDEALHRLETGEYGLCDECGGDISLGRLEAMPFSRYCVMCQDEYERTQRTMRPNSTAMAAPRLQPAEGDEENQ